MDCFQIAVVLRADPKSTGQKEIASQCEELYTEHMITYFGAEIQAFRPGESPRLNLAAE